MNFYFVAIISVNLMGIFERSIRLVRLRIAAVSNIKFELSCKSGGKGEHKVDVAGG